MSTYNKPYLSFQQQLELLKARGLDVTIHRPGLVSGATRTGHGNPDDLFARLVGGIADAGVRYAELYPTLVMLALGQFLLEAAFSSPAGTPPIEQLPKWLGHSPLTWLAIVLPFIVHLAVTRTAWGLRLRAVGEKPQAVAAMGVRVTRLRFGAVVLSGALAGLGGAQLSTAVLDRFENHMPAGLGFMAVAAMVFGRWTPLGAAGAALFFAFGNALRISLSSSAPGLLEVIPQGVLLALPYALTLLVLALQKPGASRAPAALGQPYDPELR